MGVVYRAEDTRLKRIVALKFLPPELTRDAEARERFVHEAQAASALEHVNICNIHEIDETEDGPAKEMAGKHMFIVMAYYEGETLKEKISQGPLKIEETVDIALQIAEGLKEAHAKNIVHRDVKSANIMVTGKGQIKIMDFGVAKLSGQTKLTGNESTLGTAAYMSPEQARGQEVDARTDIWSLGVILYEMVSGQLPFRGEYEQSVLYAILNQEPEPLTGVRTNVPVALERIVQKSMKKAPEERYQTAADMLVDMRELKKAPELAGKPARPSRPAAKPVVALFASVLIVSLLLVFLLGRRKVEEFHIQRTVPLTTAPGLEQDPTWSPEGTRIAYASDENGNMDVWIKQIAAGQKMNITGDNTSYDGKPSWSPDGEWIAFVSERDGGGIFTVPALGGIPKKVTSLAFAKSLSLIGTIPGIAWSPDGSELAYADAGSVYTISSAAGGISSLPLPSQGLVVGYLEPVWSPDGQRIACTGYVAEGVSTSQIWSLPRRAGNPLAVTEGTSMDGSPVWVPDGKYMFFVSDRGGSNDIWWLPVGDRGNPTRQARALTAGVGVSSISLSKDGTTLAYTKAIAHSNIWSIPIEHGRLFTLNEAMPLTSENNYIEDLDVSPDGQWIVFDSNRRGNMDIWLMRKDGSELRQLTTHRAHDWTPRWSPDGSKILFHSLRSGNRDLFILPVDGGAPVQLTDHPAEDIAGGWSPDGRSIGFISNRSGNMDLWIMPSAGGEPKQLTYHEAPDFLLVWAPDGKHIVFSSKRTGYYELFLIAEEQIVNPEMRIKPVQLTRGEWIHINACHWNENNTIIYAYGLGRRPDLSINLWAIRIADGSATPLLDLRSAMKEPFRSFSSDGERIYFTLWDRIGDIWIAELSDTSSKNSAKKSR